jgi:hypothetical protein
VTASIPVGRWWQWPRSDAERIIDELAGTEETLPVDDAGFFAWAHEEGCFQEPS